MAETISVSTAVMHQICEATGKRQLDQLKLGAECVGITPGNLDGVTSVTDVFNCLKNNKLTTNEAIPILYELLTKANVCQSKVKPLLNSCNQQHKTCKQRRDLQFALLVIDICNGIEAASLKSFRGFFIDATAISHDKHPTIERLFQFLVRGRVVWLEKLENLERALEQMGKRDVLEKVQTFKNLRGFQRQESREQSDPTTVHHEMEPVLEMKEDPSSSPAYPTGSQIVTGKEAIDISARKNPVLESNTPVSGETDPVSFRHYFGSPQGDSVKSSLSQSFQYGSQTSPLVKTGNTDSSKDSQSASSSGNNETTSIDSENADQKVSRDSNSLRSPLCDSGVISSFSQSIQWAPQSSPLVKGGQTDSSKDSLSASSSGNNETTYTNSENANQKVTEDCHSLRSPLCDSGVISSFSQSIQPATQSSPIVEGGKTDSNKDSLSASSSGNNETTSIDSDNADKKVTGDFHSLRSQQRDGGERGESSQLLHSPPAESFPDDQGGNTKMTSQHLDKAGNTEHNIDSQSISSESEPFIVTDKPTPDSHCITKCKTVCCWIVAILPVIIIVVLATVAVILTITFVVLFSKQTNGVAENAVDLTSLAHEGDTIYLGTVDGTWYKNISIAEVTQNGDASHANSIFLTDKDPKKHSTSLVYQSHTLHQDSSSYVTGSVRYQYLLDGSSVQYTMCLAYRTSGELYDSMVYVFNNAQHYWDYINEVPGAELYALCSKKLEVGMYNRSMCTPLECNISYPAFHFIAAKTGGDIFYNFSYTIHKVYLNRVDYSEVCNVFEGTDCKRDLPEATLYHVLAYTVHSESIESTITHLSLKTETPSQTVSSNLTLYMILFIFCGCLALFSFLVLTVICCFKYRKASLCSASIQ